MLDTMTISTVDLVPVAAPLSSDDWVWRRVRILEEQRQTLHVERDEARARVIDLEDRHRSDIAMTDVLHHEIADLTAALAGADRTNGELAGKVVNLVDCVESLKAEIARLTFALATAIGPSPI